MPSAFVALTTNWKTGDVWADNEMLTATMIVAVSRSALNTRQTLSEVRLQLEADEPR
jgi:hypothetical protein